MERTCGDPANPGIIIVGDLGSSEVDDKERRAVPYDQALRMFARCGFYAVEILLRYNFGAEDGKGRSAESMRGNYAALADYILTHRAAESGNMLGIGAGAPAAGMAMRLRMGKGAVRGALGLIVPATRFDSGSEPAQSLQGMYVRPKDELSSLRVRIVAAARDEQALTASKELADQFSFRQATGELAIYQLQRAYAILMAMSDGTRWVTFYQQAA